MDRNKLYTLNKWNLGLVQPRKYDGGGQKGTDDMYGYTGKWEKKENETEDTDTSSASGSDDPSKKWGKAMGIIGGASPALTGLIGGGYDTGGVGETIAAAGNAVGGLVEAIPGIGAIAGPAVKALTSFGGGVYNLLRGVKENKENIAALDANTAAANNTGRALMSSDTTASVLENAENMVGSLGFSWNDLYKNGLTTRKGTRMGNAKLGINSAALTGQQEALASASSKANKKQASDVLSSFYADGGPLGFGIGAVGLMQHNNYMDAINNRTNAIAKNNTMTTPQGTLFADGGLQAQFLDSFSSDPIGAAVRYNQGLEQLAEAEEAAAAQAAQEAAYADMQAQMANLETQNAGLEAQLASLPRYDMLAYAPSETVPEPIPEPIAPVEAEAPRLDPPTIRTVKMSKAQTNNWNYIKGQLEKTGKLNAVQIEGIRRNLQRESALDPTAVGDGGKAYGLAQWHGSRQPKNTSLRGQTQHLIDTLLNYDGKEHWIGRANYDGFMKARTPEEAHYYIAKGYERPDSSITKRLERESNLSIGRLRAMGGMLTEEPGTAKFAFGGELGTNGTDWTNGLEWVEAGGTHEENPLEGVPMGVDEEGVPNLVEEGETIYNNYVFSDRMTVPDFMYKELGLGGVAKKARKGKQMSFADASKKLALESEQRPNDPISKAGLDAALSKLAEVQETERMKKQAEKYMGLREYAYGGEMGRKYVGEGDQPNVLNLDTNNRSWWTRTFGDNGFSRFMNNATEAVTDPVGYFAGDELDALATKIANYSEPQLEKFFSTDIGQRVAQYIIDSEAAENPYLEEAGAGSIIGKGAAKMGRKFGTALTRAAKKSRRGIGRSRSFRAAQSSPGTDLVPVGPRGVAVNGPRSVAVRGASGVAVPGASGVAVARPTGVVPRGTTGVIPYAQEASQSTSWWPWMAAAAGVAGAGALASQNDDSDTQQSQTLPATTQSSAGADRTHTNALLAAEARRMARSGAAKNTARKPAASNYDYDSDTPVDAAQTVPAAVALAPAVVPAAPVDPNATVDVAPVSRDPYGPQIYASEEQLRFLKENNGDESGLGKAIKGIDVTGDYEAKENRPTTYPTWMRYAPVVGSGLMVATDLLGLTNKRDYTYANKLEAAANRAGYAPNIEFKPIGDYLTYNPMDIWYEQNRLNANARATDRALANTSSPSRAAGILANGYNSQIASGDLYRKALEYNDAKRQAVTDFNRRTNMFNSQMGLEADMANARYTQAARQYQLSGLAQAAAMRDAIDQRVGAARSANITNFLTSLGNIGRENFALNQINWDRSRRYGARANGTSYDKKTGE